MELSGDLQREIEGALKRRLLADECGNVDGFQDFSASDIGEIKLLERKSGVLAISYIRYRLKGRVPLDRAASYYGFVIQQGITVYKWLEMEAAAKGQ